jgi:hypothetical protein
MRAASVVLGTSQELAPIARFERNGALASAASRFEQASQATDMVRTGYEAPQGEAEIALVASSADRVQMLIRLGDIALYLGDFSEAQRYDHVTPYEYEVKCDLSS